MPVALIIERTVPAFHLARSARIDRRYGGSGQWARRSLCPTCMESQPRRPRLPEATRERWTEGRFFNAVATNVHDRVPVSRDFFT